MAIFDDLPDGVDADPSVTLKSIDETTTAFTRKLEKLRELVGNKNSEIRAARQSDLDRAGVVATEADGRRTVDKDRRRAEQEFIERGIAQETSAFRRELVASSQGERQAMLDALLAKTEQLDALAETYPSPTAYLARHGLGSTEHANLVAALSGAGKAELTTRAREAAMSGNRILASAIVTVVDRVPRHDRPFAAVDLAKRMVGTEHEAFLGQVNEARDRVQAAVELDSLFIKGSEQPNTKIERGLRARQAAGRVKATS